MKNHTRERSLILSRLTGLVVTLLAIVGFAACSGKTETGTDSFALTLTARGVPRAGMSLSNASATMTQTGDTAWTLSKTGVVSGGTVTWTVTATQVQTVAGHLAINGQVTLTNSGAGAATLGNVVVNLQTKSGSSWVTQSSDVADATQGDAATTAQIDPHGSSEGLSTFTENPASGHLLFMNANTNTAFPLVPEVSIASGATVTLQFSAGFDNNVLALPDGTATRTEIIFSFGNAAPSAASTPNVDINGNGVIDADEARVHSVPSRLTVTVPAPVNGNGTVTLTDTLADIVSTGSVTVTNNVFSLTATGGTIVTSIDPGTDGGTITNCAHLTSPDQTVSSGGFTFSLIEGLDLDACDTVEVQGTGGGGPCTPGTVGCGWKTGDLITRTESDWNTLTSWTTTYNTVYNSTFGVVEVGIKGTAGFSMRFNSTVAIQNYFLTSGAPAALTADLTNPTTSSSGIFGGAVLSLQLDADFSNAGVLGGTSGLKLGNLTLCGMTDASLNNRSVANFLTLVNSLLGGNTGSGYGIVALEPITVEIAGAFHNGTATSWAQQHLVNGSCP